MFKHAWSVEEGQPVQNDLVQILNIREHDFVSKLTKFWDGLSSAKYTNMPNGTLLHIAACFDLSNLISCVLNLAPKMSINDCDLWGRTALHIAAANGSFNAIDRLFAFSQAVTSKPIILRWRRRSRVLKLNVRDLNGFTPLMLAAENGHSKIVEQLALTRKVDLNINDSPHESTALHLAINGEHVDTAKVLMHHGADLRVRDRCSETPLASALRHALRSIDEPVGAELLALFWSILPQARQDLYLKAHSGGCRDFLREKSPLQMGLVCSRSLEFAQGLLDQGFDPHTPDQYGCVWFLYLDYQSNPEILDTLQARPGANINFKDGHGRTLLALLSSSQSNDCWMIEHLLENPEVDVCTKDKHGKTPLIIAAEEGSIEVFKTLLADARCNLRATDNQNLCALDYAKKRRIDAQRELVVSEAEITPTTLNRHYFEDLRANLDQAVEIVALLEVPYSLSVSPMLCPVFMDTTNEGAKTIWEV